MEFKDIQLLDNGARFLNADLHIHSYGGSSDVTDKTMTPQAIVDSAVRQRISIIAITDHNSDKNVQVTIDYARDHHGGKILVLAGVEVTTAHGHLLVYFAPERTADLKKFLSRIDLVGESGHDSMHTTKSMTDVVAEADKLGGVCIAAHIDRTKTGFDAFAPGFQNWKKDIITSTGLYGLECDAVEALLWYSQHDDNGSAGTERKNLLNARQLNEQLRARHHFAHVQGSDAHSMQQFETQQPIKRWTRIKLSELSFNAFRVALVDPTARVRACASIPQTIPRIRGVAITGGFLHEEVFHLSDNLNAFIGGRGTGKSTAIRAIAYAFGLNDDFGEFDNCPDSVTVYCQDEHGILFRYVRTRGGEIDVKAKEDNSINDVPIDSFRIEYFGQGELAKVAEDPLKNPQLFQDFLDRHLNLRDLIEKEEALVARLQENASRLNPLENAFSQLTRQKQTLKDVEAKLKLAEEGNLREIVSIQSKLASEKTIRESIDAIVSEYNMGYNLGSVPKDFDQILQTAGAGTDDATSKTTIAAIKTRIATSNAAVKQKETELNALVKACATDLAKLSNDLKISHQRMSGEVAQKLAGLRAKGLSADMAGLEQLLRQKTALGREIAAVEQRSEERRQCWEQRTALRKELNEVRALMTERRKAQLSGINSNLALTIKDYTVFVKYDDAGITEEFEIFMQEKMHGSYLQDTFIRDFCSRITPNDLADLVLNQSVQQISNSTRISTEWAKTIVETLCYWKIIFELQALAKPPKPVITVRTKSTQPRDIQVHQLSDGQRHTILLTIAMLAESNVPLIIDQPEDDLDNAFIFSSIVTTLRAIKERRQVILVTHNANIAVLGDSELLLPMHRENDYGKAKDRGSIDSQSTKVCVQNILEGGPAAFLRRKEIYGH